MIQDEKCNVKDKSALENLTPTEAIELLKEGNRRFLSDEMINRDHHCHIRETVNSQYPFAIIHGCIDSRVNPSIIFDQGIGDLFITRIAGNIINDDIVGSMEYACSVVGSKLVVVLGHTSCGAVKGACDDFKLGNLTGSLKNIRFVIKKIITDDGYDRTSANLEFVNRIARFNVEKSLDDIKSKSPLLMKLYQEKKINIVGAMYNHRTGEVEFF